MERVEEVVVVVEEGVVEEVGEVVGSVPDQDHHLTLDHLHQLDQDLHHGHQVLELEDITIINHITANHTGKKERGHIIQHITS